MEQALSSTVQMVLACFALCGTEKQVKDVVLGVGAPVPERAMTTVVDVTSHLQIPTFFLSPLFFDFPLPPCLVPREAGRWPRFSRPLFPSSFSSPRY